MKKRQLLIVAAAVGLMLAPAANADMVVTSDGSSFVGTIESITDGKLIIVTQPAGKLTVDLSMVTGIATDRVINLELSSGDTLVGTLEPAAEEGGVIVHSDVGDVSAATANITQLWPEGEENPEVTARLEAARPKWTATAEGGVIRTEGNTDTLEGHGRLLVKRKTSEDLLELYLSGKYGEENKRRTNNEYLGGIRYETNLTDRSFWYARTELEFDEFEDIDLRATAAVGLGHYWLKQPDHELKTRVGPGYRHESYDTGRSEDDFVLDLGLDYLVNITDWLQFTHSTVYAPDVEDFDNYRLAADTAVVMPLKDDRWAWKVGMRNDYNSDPAPGRDRLDNTYYTSIVLRFR
ncbi:MAG: DUF481 domain-containing protein [Phycisphaerae bacterium]|jgi:putative salt-induced outer membrane protein YdiY